MRKWFFKGVLAGSVGTAAVLAATAAVAATVGDPFRLGQSNTINATSALYGSTAKDQLDVANVGTGSNAKALGLLGRSPTAAAAAIANANGGPAVAMTVNAGKAPFTVNSATKVANLNSDKVDGLDGTSFAQGAGSRELGNRLVLAAPSFAQTLLAVPGLGHLTVQCTVTGAEVTWTNDTGGAVDLWHDYNYSPNASPGYHASVEANDSFTPVAYAVQESQTGTTIGLGKGTQSGSRDVALLHVFASQVTVGDQCSFQVLGNSWHT